MSIPSAMRSQMLGLSFLVVAAFLVTAPSVKAEERVPASRAEISLSFAPLVKRTAPAVVNVYTKKIVQTRRHSRLFDDPFFRRFFGEDFQLPGRTRQRIQNSLGSGVIVAADGIIVTNRHVIEGADSITVVLQDRREFDARIIGQDPKSDLAVLRIDAEGEKLPFLLLSDSDELEVGDLVLAIGNPFGVGQTVTSGIVSALARTNVGISDLNAFIQTDAAINPGNSGGALVDMDGRLVGVNTAIFSKSGGSLGIGFAIPANLVSATVQSLRAEGRVVRPWLGAGGETVTAEIAASLGMSRPLGVLVSKVHPKGPAAAAGLRPGDVIISLDGRETFDPDSLRFQLATKPLGGTARLTVWRRGQTKELQISLMAPPEIPPRQETLIKGSSPLEGAVIANLSPALANEMGLNDSDLGVIIVKIRRDSAAHHFNFEPLDRIEKINNRTVTSVSGVNRALLAKNSRWRIEIDRRGKSFRLDIR